MTHPLFGSEFFVETPFTKRFQATLRSSLHKRSWHVIVADCQRLRKFAPR